MMSFTYISICEVCQIHRSCIEYGAGAGTGVDSNLSYATRRGLTSSSHYANM